MIYKQQAIAYDIYEGLNYIKIKGDTLVMGKNSKLEQLKWDSMEIAEKLLDILAELELQLEDIKNNGINIEKPDMDQLDVFGYTAGNASDTIMKLSYAIHIYDLWKKKVEKITKVIPI